MSTSGQGDQFGEINKDDEPEISSTTSENEGSNETTAGKLDENSSKAATIDSVGSEAVSNIKTFASDEKPDKVNDIASTAIITDKTDEKKAEPDCVNDNTEATSPQEAEITQNTSLGKPAKEADVELPKHGLLKDISELIQAEIDKDSSVGEELELRWEEDDDDNDEATEQTAQTDDVLKMLDKELGEESFEKPEICEKQTDDVADSKIEENEGKQDQTEVAMTMSDSFEESQHIIAQIDNLTQDIEIIKTNELPSDSDKPKPNLLAEQILEKDVEMTAVVADSKTSNKDKSDHETDENPPSESLTKEEEVMDIDETLNKSKNIDFLEAEALKPDEVIDIVAKKEIEIDSSDVKQDIENKICHKLNVPDLSNEKVEAMKGTETDHSKAEILNPDKSISIDYSVVTEKSEPPENSKTTEAPEEVIRPLEVKNLESDVTPTDTLQELDDIPSDIKAVDEKPEIMQVTDESSSNMQDIDKPIDVQTVNDKLTEQNADDITSNVSRVAETVISVLGSTPTDTLQELDDIPSDIKAVDEKPEIMQVTDESSSNMQDIDKPIDVQTVNDKLNEQNADDITSNVSRVAETVISVLGSTPTDTLQELNDKPSDIKAVDEKPEIMQVTDESSSNMQDIDKPIDVQTVNDKLTEQTADDITSNVSRVAETVISVLGNDEKPLSEQQMETSDLQADDKASSMLKIDDKTSKVKNIVAKATTDEEIHEDDLDDSMLDTTISPNIHHRIKDPNVMLDIPTQELSDIEAELSDSEIYDEIEDKSYTNDDTLSKQQAKSLVSDRVINVIPKIIGITTPTIEIDATTSKLNITTVSPKTVIQTSTNKKTDDITSSKTHIQLSEVAEKSLKEDKKLKVDDKPSTSKLQVDDQQPSTSKQDVDNGKKSEKLTSDLSDDVQESDSLGLLAESSRVMDDDDDDEAEDQEPDDNDDDEDFDPYDETSSMMLEDTDDSNPPSDKAKEASKSPRVQSDEGTMDAAADGDDIECVENELPVMNMPDDAVPETTTTHNRKEQAKDSEVIDADEQIDEQPDKIINILEKVLGNLTDVKQPPSSGKVLNYVEVDGSSDSDDVQEISKPEVKDVISVKVPAEVDVMMTSGGEGGTSEMRSNKGEVVISVPKQTATKVAKINTAEVTITTGSKNLESLQIPETTSAAKEKSKEEVFNLDSDDDEEKKVEEEPKIEYKETAPAAGPSPPKPRKCVNPACASAAGVELARASRAERAHFNAHRAADVCRRCAELVAERSQELVSGVRCARPLLALCAAAAPALVEISDSEEEEDAIDDGDPIGPKAARFLEEHLADVLNETWVKYNMENRLKETEAYLLNELDLIEASAKALDSLLDDCQLKTDAIRVDFYKDYEPRRKSVGGIVIHDTPFSSYSHTEKDLEELEVVPEISRYPKRRSSSNVSDPPSKKQAVCAETLASSEQSKIEDDKDISVVKLSAESAPASLPPLGELVRPPVHAGMTVYAMRNAFGTWNKAKIMEIVQEATPVNQFALCRVKFDHKVKNPCKVLAARCLAYCEPAPVRYTIGTRVIALFKDPQSARMDAFYAGVVAEVPNPVNSFRYLVFFDDGYAQYVQHADTRAVCAAAARVSDEVHPFIREFVRGYLAGYPERPMVRLRRGETLNTEWNGQWWTSRVLQVDASIALIHFDVDNRTEWIYRGSSRLEPLFLELQAAKAGGRGRLRLPRTKQNRSNMPCVEYTRSDEQTSAKAAADREQQTQAEDLRRQRAVAKKSTTDRQSVQQQTVISTPFEGVISRVVYYTPKNAVKPLKMAPHTCTLACRRADLLSLKDLRTYNPLAKPLLSGWERQTVRYKGHREVMYRAPCGRRLRDMPELHRYLRIIQSDLSVDLFDFTAGTHCLAEFVLNRCNVGKKDLSHGKENVPVPCVNYYDDSLPEFCSYNTERTPTAGVPLNLDPAFLCGCDCDDDCQDKTKCACWKMTLEGARTIGLEGDNIGYVYRRLPEPLPSGIYECNSRCKCKQTCLNRVAQHPLQLKLQVFKTINRGWGIRALNDVPKGSFLCVYAGNLLTDATANLDGLNEGDEYLAELDYIEVVEGMKEGYEDDVPDKDKLLDKKGAPSSESESQPSSESEEEKETAGKDHDFQPAAYIPQPAAGTYFQKSLRKREKAKKREEKQIAAKKKEDCITISDDEEVREPSRFTADGVAASRQRSARVSVRELFGREEACYIMDAKVQGNIGRYLNHSCHPNVFVQNVFVDTHDPRFPWVAFFALAPVRAGAELTWNYNYDVGSVPDKVLYCYCGAPNCRGRLL